MYGTISYIILSEVAMLLDTVPGTIAFVVALTVCMLSFGVLLCVVVNRGNRHNRRLNEDTSVIPSVRAAKLRRKYR